MNNSFDKIFESELATLLQYPTGAGGKFIINCLSFHPRFHPQTPCFLEEVDERIEYITRELNDYDGYNWNDLNMGCMQFFNVESLDPYVEGTEVTAHRADIKRCSFATLLPCIAKNLHFFKTTHTPQQAEFYQRVWPNAKRIVMINCEAFIAARNGKCYRDWKVRDMLEGIELDGAFLFDAKTLLEWDALSREYERLLAWFGYSPDNMDKIRSFHADYIRTIIG